MRSATIIIRETSPVGGLPQAGQRYLCLSYNHSNLHCHEILMPNVPKSYDGAELSWYLERFPQENPFETIRPIKIEEQLKVTTKDLAEALFPSFRELLQQHGVNSFGILNVIVHGDGMSLGIHAWPWELLERVPFTIKEKGHNHPIIVSRSATSLQTYVNTCIGDTFNILLLTARPSVSEDVSYGPIARELHSIVENAQAQDLRVKLHMVRPGTWEALKRALKSKPRGYFGLVHLDTHGEVSKKRGNLCALLHFTKPIYGDHQPNRISADKLAVLLTERNVPCVVLNACSSARIVTGSKCNFAYDLVVAGLQTCVAMSHDASISMTILFLKVFYKFLILYQQPIAVCAARGRDVLARNSKRFARFGHSVDSCDHLVPVVYQQEIVKSTDDAGHPENYVQNSILEAALQLPWPCVVATPSFSSQDLDTLNLEIMLVACHVILVTGSPGCGQTSLSNKLATWWLKTGFFTNVHHLKDVLQVTQWLQRIKPNIPSDCSESHDETFDTEGNEHLVIVDNIDMFQLSVNRRQLAPGVLPDVQDVRSLIDMHQKIGGKFRLLLFVPSTQVYLQQAFANVQRYEMAALSTGEAISVASSAFHTSMDQRSSLNLNYDPLLRHIVESSNFCPLLLNHYLPQMVRSLESSHGFPDQLLGIGRLEPFQMQSVSGDSIERLRVHAKALLAVDSTAYWSLLSLTFFRGPLIANYGLAWMKKLNDMDYFPKCEDAHTTPKQTHCVQSSRRDSAFRGNEPDAGQIQTLAWTRVFSLLNASGMMTEIRRKPEECDVWCFHPLLYIFFLREWADYHPHARAPALSALETAFSEFILATIAQMVQNLTKPSSDRAAYFELVVEQELNAANALSIRLDGHADINLLLLARYSTFFIDKISRANDVKQRLWRRIFDRILEQGSTIINHCQLEPPEPHETAICRDAAACMMTALMYGRILLSSSVLESEACVKSWSDLLQGATLDDSALHHIFMILLIKAEARLNFYLPLYGQIPDLDVRTPFWDLCDLLSWPQMELATPRWTTAKLRAQTCLRCTIAADWQTNFLGSDLKQRASSCLTTSSNHEVSLSQSIASDVEPHLPHLENTFRILSSNISDWPSLVTSMEAMRDVYQHDPGIMKYPRQQLLTTFDFSSMRAGALTASHTEKVLALYDDAYQRGELRVQEQCLQQLFSNACSVEKDLGAVTELNERLLCVEDTLQTFSTLTGVEVQMKRTSRRLSVASHFDGATLRKCDMAEVTTTMLRPFVENKQLRN